MSEQRTSWVSKIHEWWYHVWRMVRYRHTPAEEEILERLSRIEYLLRIVIGGELEMAADLTALQDEVTQNGDVISSAVTLLNGLSQQLKDALAANDPAAIQAVVDQLDANTQSLADAVTANTPAAPTP